MNNSDTSYSGHTRHWLQWAHKTLATVGTQRHWLQWAHKDTGYSGHTKTQDENKQNKSTTQN